MKKRLFIVVCLLVGVVSCTYTPEETYFNDIKVNDNPHVSISLNSYDDVSMIDIYQPTTFSYNYESDFGTLEKVDIMLDGGIIKTMTGSSGSFSIEGPLLKTGTYTLKLLFTSQSGTGSLADKVGGEKVQAFREWTLEIDVEPPAIPILTMSEEKDYLKFSWTPYARSNFVEYRLRLREFGTERTITITDPEQTTYVDDEYVGGYLVQAYVETVTVMHTAQSTQLTRTDEVQLTGQYRFSDSTMLLSWTKADFTGAFAGYTIIENGVQHQAIVDVNTTSVRFKPMDVLFGLPVNFNIVVNAKKGYSPTANGLRQERLVETPRLEAIPSRFTFNITTNSIIGYFNDHVVRYSTDLIPIESVSTPSSSRVVPVKSPYLYYPEADKGIAQYNFETGALNYINVNTATNWYFDNPSVGSVSENKVISFGYKAENPDGKMVPCVQVYDFVNNISLYKKFAIYASDLLVHPTVSVDGKYLWMDGNKIFRISGGNLEVRTPLPQNHGFIGFRDDNPDEMITSNSGSVHVYDVESGALKRTITPPSGWEFAGYDISTRRVIFLGAGKKEQYAVHIDTQQKKTIRAYFSGTTGYKFINGYFIDEEGYYFKGYSN